MSVWYGDPRDNLVKKDGVWYPAEETHEGQILNPGEQFDVYLTVLKNHNEAVDDDDFFYLNVECNIVQQLEELRKLANIDSMEFNPLPGHKWTEGYEYDQSHLMWVSDSTYDDRSQINCSAP